MEKNINDKKLNGFTDEDLRMHTIIEVHNIATEKDKKKQFLYKLIGILLFISGGLLALLQGIIEFYNQVKIDFLSIIGLVLWVIAFICINLSRSYKGIISRKFLLYEKFSDEELKDFYNKFPDELKLSNIDKW